MLHYRLILPENTDPYTAYVRLTALAAALRPSGTRTLKKGKTAKPDKKPPATEQEPLSREEFLYHAPPFVRGRFATGQIRQRISPCAKKAEIQPVLYSAINGGAIFAFSAFVFRFYFADPAGPRRMLLCSCCAMPTCPQPVLASIVPPHRQRTVGLLTQSVVFRMGHFPCRAAVRESSPRRAVHCLPAVCNRPPHAERTERQSKRFCGNALRLFANSGTPLYCCAFCKDRPLFISLRLFCED